MLSKSVSPTTPVFVAVRWQGISRTHNVVVMVSQSTTCFETFEGHALYKSVSPTTLVFVAVRWHGISRTVIM